MSFGKLFMALIAGCLCCHAARAQQPTKIDPKHYKLAFENDRVQVVYVHYGPHEKSPMHEHPAGVVVNINEGHLKFTDQYGKTEDVYAKPGEARWFPPFKHKVENLTGTPYNAVYIGVKDKGDLASTAGVPIPRK